MLKERHLWIPLVLALAMGVVSAEAATIQVTIEKMVFSPADVSAKVGDTIEWVNKDVFVHTANVKGVWEVMLPVKKSGTIVLEQAGTIDYYCRFHPNMKGRIAVAAL